MFISPIEDLDEVKVEELGSPSSPSNSWSSSDTVPLQYAGESSADSDANRPKRCKISREQLHILIKSFEEEPLPNFDQRQTLARGLSMTPRSVQIWFQNRRQRLKPLQKCVSMPHLPNAAVSSMYRPSSAASGGLPHQSRHYVPGGGLGPSYPTDGLPMPMMAQSANRGGLYANPNPSLSNFMNALPYDVMEPFAATKALLGAGYNPQTSLSLPSRMAPLQAPCQQHQHQHQHQQSASLFGSCNTATPQADGLLLLLACASNGADSVPPV